MTSPENRIAEITAEARRRGLTHVTMAYFDMNGRLRAKYYHVDNLEKAMSSGTPINLGVFSVSPNEIPMPQSRFYDPANQFRDGQLRLLPATCRDFPLDAEGTGMLLIAQLVDEHSACCPRALLEQQVEKYHTLGLEPYGAFEFECYLLDEDRDSLQSRTAADVRPHRGFEVFYSFQDEFEQHALFRDLIDTCEKMGIALDTVHPEFGKLLESGLRPQHGMRIADNAALYKAVSKVIARRHGIMASYMARRNDAGQACGAHINLSLLDLENQRRLFFDANTPARMSDTMRHFFGGLQRYTPELFLLQAPHVNSYKRFRPGLFAPLSNSWGIDNKTTAYRAVTVNEWSARVEVRVTGADVNPYLALAGILIAGRHGIEQKLEPAPSVEGDGWSSASPEGLEFPKTLEQAMQKFSDSALARGELGDSFVDAFLEGRQWQIDSLNDTITDWEVRTFAEDV